MIEPIIIIVIGGMFVVIILGLLSPIDEDAVNPDVPDQEDVNNIPDRIDAVLQEAKTGSGSGQPQDNLQISEE